MMAVWLLWCCSICWLPRMWDAAGWSGVRMLTLQKRGGSHSIGFLCCGMQGLCWRCLFDGDRFDRLGRNRASAGAVPPRWGNHSGRRIVSVRHPDGIVSLPDVGVPMQRPVSQSMTALMTQKRNAGGLYERTVDSLIPRSRREKRWFFFTSFAAGLCEEIVFRGFFLYLLGRVFPAVPEVVLAAAAGFMFGAAHFYQGARVCSRLRCWGLCLVCCIWGQTRSCCVCRSIFVDFSSAFLYESEEE